ncbi:hypothetical protein N7492_008141 [Penicillium capsulatum]|uniref:Uncharacterized protein n=1 Tax=Penicillium capsulatum TaxID=69766 RepID=A0A9W9LGN0_9EURO|nr:hypothetical protein N7492_008141 [Penicillium capsulatum]KAJ6105552.1 hypothetical protein N7512_009069 [Penicillium capsulatum]
MNLYLFLFLAAVSLSAAANCPFAKFAKTGADGVPELDHDKVNAFVAKMKKFAPEDASALEEKLHAVQNHDSGFDAVPGHTDVRVDL